MLFSIFLIILTPTALCYLITPSKHHPLSNKYIALINQRQSTWKAGRNFNIADWERAKKIASGVLFRPGGTRRILKYNSHNEDEDVPKYFDSRKVWPRCKSIRQIRDQSHCGSCWAFGAVEAMSDRICIHSNQTKQVHVSAEDLTACCWSCGNGCSGGHIEEAWVYWQENGIVTGGPYNSSQGCKAYSLQPCEHHVKSINRPSCESLQQHTPKCIKRCDDSHVNYQDSFTFGNRVRYFFGEKQIQLEIMKNGPVEGVMLVFDDFFSYKSGIYQRISNRYIGGHAIKLVGWGIEKGHKYWIVANSWNTDWGDNGYFKILRGVNHCGIESQIIAGLPIIA